MTYPPIMNLEGLAAAAEIAAKLKGVPLAVEGAFISDGHLLLWSPDDYQIGEFYVEDDFWLFRVGESVDDGDG